MKKLYQSFDIDILLCKYFLKRESDFARATNFNFTDNKIKRKKLKLNNNNKVTIGISWYTNNKQFGPKRNIKLKQFAPLFKSLDANFRNDQLNICIIFNHGMSCASGMF